MEWLKEKYKANKDSLGVQLLIGVFGSLIASIISFYFKYANQKAENIAFDLKLFEEQFIAIYWQYFGYVFLFIFLFRFALFVLRKMKLASYSELAGLTKVFSGKDVTDPNVRQNILFDHLIKGNLIRILAGNGYEDIVQGKTLFERLSEKPCDIKSMRINVLLLEPDQRNLAIHERVKALKDSGEEPSITVNAYIDRIIETVGHLKKIEDENPRTVTVNFYRNTPQWKLYISNNDTIVRHYPTNEKGKDGLLFKFEGGNYSSKTNFSNFYMQVFDDKQKQVDKFEELRCDLSKWQQPQPSQPSDNNQLH